MMVSNLRVLDRICLGVIATVILISGYGALYCGSKQEARINREREILNERSGELNSAEKNLKYLTSRLDHKKKELGNIKEKIPFSDGVGVFLKDLDRLINKRGVELLNVSPQPPLNEGKYSIIPIDIDCTGPFISLYKLVCDLENMRRLIVIEKLVIDRSDKDQECHMELIARIFHQ